MWVPGSVALSPQPLALSRLDRPQGRCRNRRNGALDSPPGLHRDRGFRWPLPNQWPGCRTGGESSEIDPGASVVLLWGERRTAYRCASSPAWNGHRPWGKRCWFRPFLDGSSGQLIAGALGEHHGSTGALHTFGGASGCLRGILG